MENVPVTIIVKAPNQQFEDQTIQCEISWTIKRLKTYLSEVYPNKPKSEEQKLIYSGQLLTDTTVLKDILRQYDGQDTHTVHLVFTPKNRIIETVRPKPTTTVTPTSPVSATNSTTTTTQPLGGGPPAVVAEGLRQRTTNASSYQTAGVNVAQPAAQAQMVFNSMPSYPMSQQQANEMLLTQQMGMQNMMQQIYMQYINQYMNAVQPSNSQMPYRASSGNIPSAVPYMQQQFPHMTQNTMFWQYQLQQQHLQHLQHQQAAAAAAIGSAPGQPRANMAADLAQQQAGGVAVAPDAQPQRFLNMPDDAGQQQRDWLDLFYATSRLMVLVTLVYFYSSPVRCLIVILFIILYYLYHIGFFRQLQQEANNNQVPPQPAAAAAQPGDANVAENVVADAAAAVAAAAGVGDGEAIPAADAAAAQPANAGDDAPTSSTADVNTIAEDQAHRTPVIALIRTFILSFFASLIPETPAL